ncbi:unnamed protein product [Leptosia nina]|uniref:HEAT repeat-containing protein 6 n=1 Tax=Leptosia nina TaxID=320188 RepID=A0AAV1JSD1_9NEOP
MSHKSPEEFSVITEQLCNHLQNKDQNTGRINFIIDELNAKLYKTQLSIRLNDAALLLSTLCTHIKPSDEALSAKASHLINNITTKQIIPLSNEYICQVLLWHIDYMKRGSDMILPDILHNMQCILQSNTQNGQKFINELIGKHGVLLKYIDTENGHTTSQNSLQTSLVVLKSIVCLLPTADEQNYQNNLTIEIQENVTKLVVKYLMKSSLKAQDEFLYCKVVIAALRVLSHIYFNCSSIEVPLPELMGICQYFILYGLVKQNNKLDKIMPSQQTVAATPVKPSVRGGMKQKVRKHRNSAIETLKKEIPVSDKSLMREVDNFENNSAYKPASKNYLEPAKSKTYWALTSDSDMSDMENSREAKLVALKSRVRQSASNLFLVLFKIKDKREIFGFWWALFPDSPDANNWLSEGNAKKTLAYCAITDPIASCRANALSVTLALLSGSKMYLGQAEVSKKSNTSFIPFSVSLGYMITCMHKVLVDILDSERSKAVLLVALKCCSALVQATPYHKMQEGLISDLVRSTRKFLVHRNVTLQVGALITMGCVLSIDPKVNEVLKAIQKDTTVSKCTTDSDKENKSCNEGCDDFEEGYSDDEMFSVESVDRNDDVPYFSTWILDVCFKNIGWMFRGQEKIICQSSVIPVKQESLQVLSAIAFHHLGEVLKPHLVLLADILVEVLQHEHQDVVFQAVRLISIIGDSIQKLEQRDEAPPLAQCVYFWEKLLTPLSSVLQSQDNSPVKVIVCDCIANVGEKSFKELPTRTQVLCCALLVGSCSDEEPSVRAAAVRALAMAVMYRTLREDICFVSDCGENILRALAEPTLVVRLKAAWALANLSDALVLNVDDQEMERIDDDLLLRLLEVSVRCANDNDKIKMNATRALGNMLRLIREEDLQRSQLKPLCEAAMSKLLECACKVSNMKVRWNACYALGNAMKNETLFACFKGWQSQVFLSLCILSQDCKNLKVRINAAVALRAPTARAQYDEHFSLIWRGVMEAMQNAANVDDFSEYRHKDNLIEQLCVTLAHMCCLLKQSDLTDILDPLVFHFDCAKSLYAQLYQKLPPRTHLV